MLVNCIGNVVKILWANTLLISMIINYRKSSYDGTTFLRLLFILPLPLLFYYIITDFHGQVLYPRPDI